MKIAVSARGSGPEAAIDPRFGRCAHFVIHDTDRNAYETVDNRAAAAAGGSGVRAAQELVRLGAGAVLTGQIGPKALKVLEAAGVRCYTGAEGTVSKALAGYAAGRLTPAGETTGQAAGIGRRNRRAWGAGGGSR